jgi:hypothetical protein
MTAPAHNIFGLEIGSDSRVFFGVLGFHILNALIAVVTGVVAMLSAKRPGRHPRLGTVYYWCLSLVFLTSTILAAMRWSEGGLLALRLSPVFPVPGFPPGFPNPVPPVPLGRSLFPEKNSFLTPARPRC